MRALRARGDLHLGLPSMRCVGYRQAWEYLDGAYDFAALRDKGIAATRQLAKRQLTWLRSMPQRIIIDCLHAQPAAGNLNEIAARWPDCKDAIDHLRQAVSWARHAWPRMHGDRRAH